METESQARYDDFRQCVEDAPEGTHLEAKELHGVIGEAMDQLMNGVRARGLQADNCDLAHVLETAMYDYIKQSNPDASVFPLAEGFGSCMNGPARDRVIQQTMRDHLFLASRHKTA